MGKFVITKRKNDEFQFSLLASNGQVILISQGYKSERSCMSGVDSVIRNSQNEALFERLTTSNGKFHFNLNATNGEIIGSSFIYTSEAARENGINSVMNNAKSADVEIEY